jgi:CHAT domain-containing protein
LVIGDPGVPGGGGALPAARAEANEVATLLAKAKVSVDFFIGAEATRNRVVYQLMNHEYDVIHYAGHGTFSSDDPLRGTGWMFSDGLLQGRHLTMARRMPALVLANACHSGRVSETTGLPGLADEFLGRGVRNLVGTARAVNDESANAFSRHFYAELLRARPGDPTESLGKAVLKTRVSLADGGDREWHVYQLYGDPEFRFWQDHEQS